jgi:hypothetical protein
MSISQLLLNPLSFQRYYPPLADAIVRKIDYGTRSGAVVSSSSPYGRVAKHREGQFENGSNLSARFLKLDRTMKEQSSFFSLCKTTTEAAVQALKIAVSASSSALPSLHHNHQHPSASL